MHGERERESRKGRDGEKIRETYREGEGDKVRERKGKNWKEVRL